METVSKAFEIRQDPPQDYISNKSVVGERRLPGGAICRLFKLLLRDEAFVSCHLC